MDVTFGELLNNIDDLCQNYTSSTIDNGNKMRQANRAIEYVQRRLGLPSDKKIQTFYYYDDIPFYDCEPATNELIKLYYNLPNQTDLTPNPNIYLNEWFNVPDTQILPNSGYIPQQNWASLTSINGKNQFLLNGRNLRGRTLIQSFDNLQGIGYSSDIVNASIDTNVKVQGVGSMKFDINAGVGDPEIFFNGLWNIQSALNTVCDYRFYVDFPAGTTGYFDEIELRLETDPSNYYVMTTSDQTDGEPWIDTSWSFLSFQLDSTQTVGSPNSQLIQTFRFVFKKSGTFAPIQNMRVDYLYQIFPDLMNALCYRAYKGTNAAGTDLKIILDDTTDLLLFGPFAPDLIGPIALKATLALFPQLRGNMDFWSMYKSDFEDTLKQFGKVYPRQRTVNMGQTTLNRP